MGTSILVLYASNYSSQIDEPLSSPLSLPSSLLHVYFSSPLCGCVVIFNILWILKILSKRKFLLANLHRCPSSLKFIFSPLLDKPCVHPCCYGYNDNIFSLEQFWGQQHNFHCLHGRFLYQLYEIWFRSAINWTMATRRKHFCGQAGGELAALRLSPASRRCHVIWRRVYQQRCCCCCCWSPLDVRQPLTSSALASSGSSD